MAKCGQCLQMFHEEMNPPRVCNGCGNTLCEQCLAQINTQENSYKCPYCKTSTKSLWAKNQSLISLLDCSSGSKCQPHNRKAVSLCCSANCIVSPAICDIAQCSKLHKQKGLNNLPLSFFAETPIDSRLETAEIVVGKLMNQTRVVVEDILKEEEARFLRKCAEITTSCTFKKETQELMTSIRCHRFQGISSKNLAEIKKEMMSVEENQETDMIAQFMQLIDDEKKALVHAIICAIDKIQINLFDAIVLQKANSTPSERVEKRITPEIIVKRSSTRQPCLKSNTRQDVESIELRDELDRLYQQATKLCSEPRTHLEYQLVRQVIGRDFNIKLLFSSIKDSPVEFKTKIGGQSNLFIRVQLGDGKILGSFFKQPYPTKFQSDMFVTDSDAFVYWLNQFRVYKAAKASIAQYDISPDYLFSCGSTYNWDGFWFRKDFQDINPEMPGGNSEIKSKQYVDLNIPLSNRKVIRFEAYQLHVK